MSECRTSAGPPMDPMLQGLLEELECPVCREYVVPPIAMCVSGHSICTSCRNKLQKCPICTKIFSNSRNFALESIAGKLSYPCKYQDVGCRGSFSLEQLAAHQAECPHQTYKCPFATLDTQTCAWEGAADALVNHIKITHAELCNTLTQAGKYKTRLWDIDKGPFWCRAIFAMGEVFFWLTKLIDSHVYSCVFYVGPAVMATAYKYRVTINKVDKCGTATASHVASSYHKTSDEIFQNCECIVFHHDFVKRCMDPEKCLLVEIEIFKTVS